MSDCKLGCMCAHLGEEHSVLGRRLHQFGDLLGRFGTAHFAARQLVILGKVVKVRLDLQIAKVKGTRVGVSSPNAIQ